MIRFHSRSSRAAHLLSGFVGCVAALLLLVACNTTPGSTYRQAWQAKDFPQRALQAGFEPESTANALRDIWHGLTIVVAEATGAKLPPPGMVTIFAQNAYRFRVLTLPLINESSQTIDTAAFDRMFLREMAANPHSRRWVLAKGHGSEITTPAPETEHDYILRITLHDLPSDLRRAPNELAYMWEILDAKTHEGVRWGGERILTVQTDRR